MNWTPMRFWIVAMVVVVTLGASCADSKDAENLETNLPEPLPAPTAVGSPLSHPEEVIYVVDPNGGAVISNIIVLDGITAKTLKTYTVRHGPSIAFSRDGNAMFVADSYRIHVTRGDLKSYISSFDTRTGSLLSDDVPLTNITRYKFYPLGDPMFFASADGDVLFTQRYDEQNPGYATISVLDKDSFEVIREAQTPDCGLRIRAFSDEWLCVNSSGRVDEGFTTTVSRIDPIKGIEIENLAVFRSGRVVEAVKPKNADTLLIVTQGGRVTVVDLHTRSVTHAELEHDEDSSLGHTGTVDATPDGSRLFVAFIGNDEEHSGFVVSEIRVYDTTSWEVVGVIEPDDPAMHFAISASGQRLYTVSPFEQSVAIYNTADLKLTAFRSGVGATPARIVVPPVMKSSAAKSD